MLTNDKSNTALRFIFTEEDFYLDLQSAEPSDRTAGLAADFILDRFHALYRLGLEGKPEALSPSGSFLYLLSDTFFKNLTDLPELELARENARAGLSDEEENRLLQAVPFAIGAEFITPKWISGLYARMNTIFAEEMAEYNGTVEMYLTEKNQRLRVPERIFFHLVESRGEEYPFAFLATYATKGADGRVSHVPLQYAMTEYREDREKLITLLSCLNRAAGVSDLIAGFMETGEMFHPLKLTSQEAYTFLKQIEAIEGTGILCRIPNWWKKKTSSVAMSVSIGEDRPSMLGFDTLVTLQPGFMANGVALSREDIMALLAQTEGLALIKGKWVEVDHARLNALLEEMDGLPRDITLKEALRMELGAVEDRMDVGALVTNGKWLTSLLKDLRRPDTIRKPALPKSFHAQLRPYQQSGYTWLTYMDKLGFGACLADDMGLGKTVQVLAYLEKTRKAKKDARTLLIVPASLLGNWQKEIEKFTPSMVYRILHGKNKEFSGEKAFLTITTYGMAVRLAQLKETEWDCIILDEAQAIKNPATRQTREIKKLSGRMRIAMTGTPIENDLTNLWSLFDFLNKGLMGTSAEFREFCRQLKERPEGYARLKTMVSPFMLRRSKTDKSIIDDLPDKMEIKDYVQLSGKQVVLYKKVVADLEKQMADAERNDRSGLVLAAIIRLKQICNHPDQYLGQNGFSMNDSGKFQMLAEICETIYEKRERVLVFTQFREIADYLASCLAGIFKQEGFVLHGGTPVAKRTKMVDAFQGRDYVPFMVLSVKAGGTGLNLTGASHVIHFDRWWNPAVENQATDRAYRIGQTRNVMVHKLICQGTIEEKIDAMIESKKELSDHVIGSQGEKWITELSNEELMRMLRLG